MRGVKIIGIFGLVVGLAGLSHAGFMDALKSTAGSALNEVAGTAVVSQEIPIKDGSSRSIEDFKKECQFSDEEYRQWLQDVVRQLKSSGWKPVPGISVDGMTADGKRAKISEDEAKKVFCMVENNGIFLAQEYVYFFAGDACIKFNYATLATGKCDERGDVLRNPESGRVIYAIEKCCASAKQKISSEKSKQDALVAKMEREKREAAEAQEHEQQRKEREAQLAAEKAEKEKAAAQQQEELQRQAQAILAWDDAPAKAKATDMKKKTIVFKSLYLGMPSEDAYKLLYRAIKAKNTSPELAAVGFSQMGGDFADIWAKGAIYAGSTGEVVELNLNAIVVNAIFDAEGQEASTFVETFIKACGIPRMDPSDDFSSWTYTKLT